MMDKLDHLPVKLGVIFLTAALLALGQVIISKFARTIVVGGGWGTLVRSALQTKYFYMMFAVNGLGSIGYILLTRRFPLQEIFILNLVTMAFIVTVASHFTLGEPLELRKLAGYVLGVVAVALLMNR